jgi:hypothetical protein
MGVIRGTLRWITRVNAQNLYSDWKEIRKSRCVFKRYGQVYKTIQRE